MNPFLCLHCRLEDYDEEDETLHRQSAADKIHHMSNEELLSESGKLMMLMDLLQKLSADGHRTLVFSQSRKMLDIIEKLLKSDVSFCQGDLSSLKWCIIHDHKIHVQRVFFMMRYITYVT